MAVLGFSGSPSSRESNVDRMVKSILEGSGKETEFIKLSELTYSGCKACPDKCAKSHICALEDDLKPYWQKIMDAEALVLGASSYFSNINAITHAFLERFFCFRHVEIALSGKPVVLVACAGGPVEGVLNQMNVWAAIFGMSVIESVGFMSQIPPCFTCGRHDECRIGGLYMSIGEAALSFKVTPESFRKWEDDQAVKGTVIAAAEKLKAL